MMRVRSILTVGCVAWACAAPPTRGQTGTAPVVRSVPPNIYEVAPEQIPSAEEEGFIQVSGSATVQVPADRARISLAMETRAATADAAAGANADAMDAVLRALRAAQLPGLEIETFGYSLQPQYATDGDRTRSIAGYAAYNNVRATITDVDAVGRLIDVAIGAGANRVAAISFFAADTEAARAQALAEAVRNARAQAIAIAEALGYRLGPPVEVNGSAQRPGPRELDFAQGMALRGAAAAAPTPIEAGDQSVAANVSIRFSLGPEL